MKWYTVFDQSCMTKEHFSIIKHPLVVLLIFVTSLLVPRYSYAKNYLAYYSTYYTMFLFHSYDGWSIFMALTFRVTYEILNSPKAFDEF